MSTFQSLHKILLDNASALALVISLFVFWRQYRTDKKTDKFNLEQLKLQREYLELQKGTAGIEEKISNLIVEQHEKQATKAQLFMKIEKEGDKHCFVIQNISNANAQNVTVEFKWTDSRDIPIIQSDYDRKFPVKIIPPGEQIKLNAYFTLASSLAYNAVLKWTNPDNTQETYPVYVAL